MRQLAETFGAKGSGHRVSHAVAARVGQPAVVVRPGQHVELEVIVLLEVTDQVAAAVHVGALKLHRSAIADCGVVVGEGGVEGVVRSGSTQHRIAGEPHAPASGVCGRAAELVAGLDHHDGKPFARRGVRADQPTTGSGDDHVGFVVPHALSVNSHASPP